MEIIHERAKLRLMDGNDVETLFSIVEGNREIWAYLISKMDSVQDMQQYVQKAIQGYGKGTQIPFVVVSTDEYDCRKYTSIQYFSRR